MNKAAASSTTGITLISNNIATSGYYSIIALLSCTYLITHASLLEPYEKNALFPFSGESTRSNFGVFALYLLFCRYCRGIHYAYHEFVYLRRSWRSAFPHRSIFHGHDNFRGIGQSGDWLVVRSRGGSKKAYFDLQYDGRDRIYRFCI